MVNDIINAGCSILGENYIEEALEMMKDIQNQNVSWHMIRHIQSCKVREVCEIFCKEYSLDRVKNAKHLNRFLNGSGKRFLVLLECNIRGDEKKYGIHYLDISSMGRT